MKCSQDVEKKMKMKSKQEIVQKDFEIIDEDIINVVMSTDLNNALKTQDLSKDQIIWFTYQILRGLKYLHTSNIIHRVKIQIYTLCF